MGITVSTPLEGAGLALFVYAMTFIIALIVVGIIKLIIFLIRRRVQSAGPPKKERKIEEVLT